MSQLARWWCGHQHKYNVFLSLTDTDEVAEESVEDQKQSDEGDINKESTQDGKFISHRDSMKKHKKQMRKKSE